MNGFWARRTDSRAFCSSVLDVAHEDPLLPGQGSLRRTLAVRPAFTDLTTHRRSRSDVDSPPWRESISPVEAGTSSPPIGDALRTRTLPTDPGEVICRGDRFYFLAKDSDGERCLWACCGLDGEAHRVPMPTAAGKACRVLGLDDERLLLETIPVAGHALTMWVLDLAVLSWHPIEGFPANSRVVDTAFARDFACLLVETAEHLRLLAVDTGAGARRLATFPVSTGVQLHGGPDGLFLVEPVPSRETWRLARIDRQGRVIAIDTLPGRGPEALLQTGHGVYFIAPARRGAGAAVYRTDGRGAALAISHPELSITRPTALLSLGERVAFVCQGGTADDRRTADYLIIIEARSGEICSTSELATPASTRVGAEMIAVDRSSELYLLAQFFDPVTRTAWTTLHYVELDSVDDGAAIALELAQWRGQGAQLHAFGPGVVFQRSDDRPGDSEHLSLTYVDPTRGLHDIAKVSRWTQPSGLRIAARHDALLYTDEATDGRRVMLSMTNDLEAIRVEASALGRSDTCATSTARWDPAWAFDAALTSDDLLAPFPVEARFSERADSPCRSIASPAAPFGAT